MSIKCVCACACAHSSNLTSANNTPFNGPIYSIFIMTTSKSHCVRYKFIISCDWAHARARTRTPKQCNQSLSLFRAANGSVQSPNVKKYLLSLWLSIDWFLFVLWDSKNWYVSTRVWARTHEHNTKSSPLKAKNHSFFHPIFDFLYFLKSNRFSVCAIAVTVKRSNFEYILFFGFMPQSLGCVLSNDLEFSTH